LYGNHKPRITDTSSGTWRRLHLVGWNVHVPEAQQIQNYHEVLLQKEREGILAWIVAGAIDFFANGVPAPERITADTNAYREIRYEAATRAGMAGSARLLSADDARMNQKPS
jgi:putative DNA primase/helicase